jgi:hypothetical protein
VIRNFTRRKSTKPGQVVVKTATQPRKRENTARKPETRPQAEATTKLGTKP